MADDVLWDRAAKWLNRIDECETGGDKVSLMCRLMGEYEKELSAVKAENERMREVVLDAGCFCGDDGIKCLRCQVLALATPKTSEKPS